jgi:hypothetical protein
MQPSWETVQALALEVPTDAFLIEPPKKGRPMV